MLLLKESAAADRPFDLMLFDDGPSGSDAEHLVEAVRTDESLRATPLILMGPVTRCREAGWLLKHHIAATLTKPVRTSQLMAALSLVLHRSPKVATELPPGTTAKAGLTQQERRDRILLVEDNEANQMVVRWFLHETGYWVDVVATGKEALEALKRTCYDVLLLDIHLPDLDGLEVAEMIRRDPRWASLPILALTAATMPEDQARCLAAGVTSYLVKPLDRHTLVAAVANALVSSQVGGRTGRASLEYG